MIKDILLDSATSPARNSPFLATVEALNSHSLARSGDKRFELDLPCCMSLGNAAMLLVQFLAPNGAATPTPTPTK